MQSSVMVEMELPRITKLNCKAYVDRAVPAFLTAGRLHRERKSGCSLSPLSPYSQLKLTFTCLGTISVCVSCQARDQRRNVHFT